MSAGAGCQDIGPSGSPDNHGRDRMRSVSYAAMDVSRRRLLSLAGYAGLAATAGACSTSPRSDSSSSVIAETSAAAPVQRSTGTTTTPTPSTVSRPMLCRDAWGAVPARPGGRSHVLTRMTIHHTAVVLGDNSNAPARLRQHQRYHQERGHGPDAHVAVRRAGRRPARDTTRRIAPGRPARVLPMGERGRSALAARLGDSGFRPAGTRPGPTDPPARVSSGSRRALAT